MRLAKPLSLVTLMSLACQCFAASATQPADVRTVVPHTNTVFTPAAYPTLAEWDRRRDFIREQVRLAAGLIPEPLRTPLNAHIFGKLVRDGYTIEKVYFESSPGIYVTGNLYRPLNAVGPCPAVACPHGHWKEGRLHQDARGDIPARCITLARAGAVVFAYDMVGRTDGARKFTHGDAALDTPETALWGIGHFQLQTWNSIRVIDFLQSLPDVDGKRIGVTGASGGGTQTFILGAVDDRVTVDCPVNMISSTMQGGCICENAPLLRIGTNNMEIAATFVPRPRLMISATGDWTKLTPTVEFPFARGIYALYGAADHIANVHVDAEHNYNKDSREAMYAFFGKWLFGENHPPIHEGHIPVEKPEDMLVFNDSNVPVDLPTIAQIIEKKKAETIKLFEPYKRSEQLQQLSDLVRRWARHAIDADVFPGVADCDGQFSETGDVLQYRGTLERKGRRLPILGMASRQHPGKTAAIIIDPEGCAAAVKHRKLVDALLAEGMRVIFVEPFSTGQNLRTVELTAEQKKFFTTFNRSDAAESVYDLLTVFAAAEYDCHTALKLPKTGLEPIGIGDEHGLESLRSYCVIAFGRMGPAALLAHAIKPVPVLIADMNGFNTAMDADYVRALFVPGIQRVGGLPAIAAVAAPAGLYLHNTADKFDLSWQQNGHLQVTSTPVSDADILGWIRASKIELPQ